MSKANKDQEELKSKFANIIKLGITIALGMVLVIYPGETLDTLVKVLGIAIVVISGVVLASTLIAKDKIGYDVFQVVGAIIALIAGIIILADRGLIISIFPIVTGLSIIAYGVFGVINALNFKKYYSMGWQASLAFSIITIIVGLVIAGNPFGTMNTIVRLIGIVLIYNGAVGIYMQLNRRKKNLVYHANEIVDGEAIEIDDED